MTLLTLLNRRRVFFMFVISLLFPSILYLIFFTSSKECKNEVVVRKLYSADCPCLSNETFGTFQENIDRSQNRMKSGKKFRKIRIISPHFTRTDILKLQYYSIKKYISDKDWEFIVINNAPTPKMEKKFEKWILEADIRRKIHDTVVSFNDDRVKHVYMDEDTANTYVHNVLLDKHLYASKRCANVFQWLLVNYVFNFDGLSFVFDGDMFFYDYINIGRMFEDNDIVLGGLIHDRGKVEGELEKEGTIFYVYNGVILVDGKRMPDKQSFSIASGPGCDVGCESRKYLRKHPDIFEKFFRLKQIDVNDVIFTPQLLPSRVLFNFLKSTSNGRDSVPEIMFPVNVIHYRSGGNWRGSPKEMHLKQGEKYLKYFRKYFACMDKDCTKFAENFEDLRKVWS